MPFLFLFSAWMAGDRLKWLKSLKLSFRTWLIIWFCDDCECWRIMSQIREQMPCRSWCVSSCCLTPSGRVAVCREWNHFSQDATIASKEKPWSCWQFAGLLFRLVAMERWNAIPGKTVRRLHSEHLLGIAEIRANLLQKSLGILWKTDPCTDEIQGC